MLVCSTGGAATYSPAIHFYASPMAIFSSGQSLEALLHKGLMKTETRYQLEIEWQKKRMPLESKDVVTALNFAQNNFAHSLIDTYLRTHPKFSTTKDNSIITTVPKDTMIYIQKIRGNWAQIKFFTHSGWVQLDHLVTRFDFANWAWVESSWEKVLYRQGEFLKTANALIPITLNQKIFVTKDRGIVINNIPDGPRLRSYVKVLKAQQEKWNLSFLKGHGFVWWKDPHFRADPTEVGSIKTDELLKNSIFSYAVESTSFGPLGLISSNGIYLTSDQSAWKKLPSFGDRDYPVAISNKGILYVGPFRSRNLGKSFENFINPMDLAQKVENLLSRPAQWIKIKNIQPISSGKVQLKVEANSKLLNLEL